MGDFAWIIEAPGPNYLTVNCIGLQSRFTWSKDHRCAIRFINSTQADDVMMAVRRLDPELFAFAVNLGEARPVEHGWIATPPESTSPDGSSQKDSTAERGEG